MGKKLSNLKRGKPFLDKLAKSGLLVKKEQKLILSIGDDGAILTYILNGEVEHFMAATLSSAEELKVLQEFLDAHSKTPVYILIDVIDQNYALTSLPGVNAMTVGPLVKKKLAKDFAATDITNAIQLKRLTTGRKDWQYLFVSAPFISPLSDWINLVMKAANPVGGIYMLPLETITLANKLNATIFTKGGEKQQSTYQVFLTHNKISGFRQTAFKSGQLLFTRVVDTGMEFSPDVTAANIEQELRNALEYLRRLSYQDSDGLDIFIIVGEEVKQHLISLNLQGKNVIILTPFEASGLLQLNNAVTVNARFADILIAANFAKYKPFLLFNTQATQQLVALKMLHKMAFIGTSLLIPALAGLVIMKALTLVTLYEEVDDAALKKSQLERQWGDAQKGAYSIAESYQILDLVTLHKLLGTHSASPLAILKQFDEMQGDNVTVKSVEWAEKERRPEIGQPPIQPSAGQGDKTIQQTVFDVELYNSSNKLEGVIESFDLFTKQVQDNFSNYNVSYSNLPEKLDLDAQNTKLPIKITISGPKASADNPK